MAGQRPSSHVRFVEAVWHGNEAEAVRLLEGGEVAVNARVGKIPSINCEASIGPSSASDKRSVVEHMPLLFYAIFAERGNVVRALVRAGVDLNALVFQHLATNQGGVAGEMTAAGCAISLYKPAMLALVRGLGARISAVYVPWTNQAFSAQHWAVVHRAHVCLEFILEDLYPGRPMKFSISSFEDQQWIYALPNFAGGGSRAFGTFAVLHKKGFDFKVLEDVEHTGNVISSVQRGQRRFKKNKKSQKGKPPAEVVSAADEALWNAVDSGYTKLVQFLVKECGLFSSAENMEAAGQVSAKMPDQFNGAKAR